MISTFLFPAVALGMGVLITFTSPRRRSKHMQAAEEMAHAAASERRRERRYGCLHSAAKVEVLGGDGVRIACRIVGASRNRMRIALPVPLPVGYQVCVEWDDEFFVGTSREVMERDGEHITGLQLLTASFRPMRHRQASFHSSAR